MKGKHHSLCSGCVLTNIMQCIHIYNQMSHHKPAVAFFECSCCSNLCPQKGWHAMWVERAVVLCLQTLLRPPALLLGQVTIVMSLHAPVSAREPKTSVRADWNQPLRGPPSQWASKLTSCCCNAPAPLCALQFRTSAKGAWSPPQRDLPSQWAQSMARPQSSALDQAAAARVVRRMHRCLVHRRCPRPHPQAMRVVALMRSLSLATTRTTPAPGEQVSSWGEGLV